MFKRKQGRYDGPVGFDGDHFYAVKTTRGGDVLDRKTRLKSLGGEWHYAERDYGKHNDLNGGALVHLPVGGED